MSGDRTSRRGQQQPRAFDITVFNQDRVWFDVDGYSYELASMSQAERDSLYEWLCRHSRHFYIQTLRHVLTQSAVLLLADEDNRWDHVPSSLPELVFLSHLEWLHETVLVSALRR